jgi:hypothetical protein
MLLNRLFKFVQTEEPVNNVLAGYFEKLVISLRKRKEQQFVKFLFGAKPELVTDLLQHIQNTSITEVVKNIVTIQASNFDLDLQQVIKKSKASMVNQLVEKLASNVCEETTLCSTEIIKFLLDDHREY